MQPVLLQQNSENLLSPRHYPQTPPEGEVMGEEDTGAIETCDLIKQYWFFYRQMG